MGRRCLPGHASRETKAKFDRTHQEIGGKGMIRTLKHFFCACCASLWLVTAFAAAQEPPLDTAVLNQYCITCHNQRAKTAGLMLDTLDYQNLEKDAPTWEKVIRKIKTGMMPPAGIRRPERAVLDRVAGDIEKRLDSVASRNPNPGSAALHRLNRTEYGNVIRDLLALDVDVAALLP